MNEVGYRDVVFDMLLVVHTIPLAGALRPPEAYPGCAHFHFDHHFLCVTVSACSLATSPLFLLPHMPQWLTYYAC